MAKKEVLQPNHTDATLFVGVGGIGSKIIKGVAELCINDDTSNLRFVVLDTDVNDLIRLESGAVITTVQTSSTRSIKDYLDFDQDAKLNWFPENRILDSKTVSEGAGQVRAISRLALNATIKQGRISKLYEAIDELYLKNGLSKSQAIKVIVASTVAGGTGSGIAMEVAMLIREYLSVNYPESAAIIRGFMIMPGVMDTVISTESERAALRRNGYATLKEINAFMMKGSGFFDSNPELKRYQGLSITVPSATGSDTELDNLPFDFCFLLDRIDDKQHSMQRLPQYINFMSQSIYEQCIGPMSGSAKSKEDNIVREFIVPEKLGRCRFGGAGAAVLRYPYAKIRDYIAYNWAEKQVLGVSNEAMTDEMKDALIKQSWLRYDLEFRDKEKEFENNMNAVESDRPERDKVYMEGIERKDNPFSETMQVKYLEPKFKNANIDANKVSGNSALPIRMDAVADDFIEKFSEKAIRELEASCLGAGFEDIIGSAKTDANPEEFGDRYDAITQLSGLSEETKTMEDIAKKWSTAVLRTDRSISADKKEEHTVEAYLVSSNKIMHPSAARYMLYKLEKAVKRVVDAGKPQYAAYESMIQEITEGKTEDTKATKVNQKDFEVGFNFGKERSLKSMCDAIDDKNKLQQLDSTSPAKCNEKLTDYYNAVRNYYRGSMKFEVCSMVLPMVSELIRAYEAFFKSFDGKVATIEKKKDNIVSEMKFNNGDCRLNLFCRKEDLDMLVKDQGEGSGSTEDQNKLYAEIYDSIKSNSIIAEKTKNNPMLREAQKDIFDDVIIGYYKKMVEKNCDEKIDLDILHAIKYEFEMSQMVKVERSVTDEQKQAAIKYSQEQKNIDSYIQKKIDQCRDLSSPGISKKDFGEAREVSAVAFGEGVKDGNGIIAGKFLDEKNRGASISKYELHFFSSSYNIMPTQLTKLSYAKPSTPAEAYSIKRKKSGDYFTIYQDYMEKIGPDSKLNPIITPHIDKRWNSISVMPELDLDYQRDLMKYIHKAFVYGFLYGVITKYVPSDYAPGEWIYRYNDSRNGQKPLIVSNRTECDELYEVLDALYFDRAAVNSIHREADAKRKDDRDTTTKYEDTEFVRSALSIKRREIISVSDDVNAFDEIPMSLFEIPILYYDSLPANIKDAAEIATMTGAIIDIMHQEISTFCDKCDVKPLLAKTMIKHFDLLVENYGKMPEILGRGAEDVILIIKEEIISKLKNEQIKVPTELENFQF